jgi:hypothetical protein
MNGDSQFPDNRVETTDNGFMNKTTRIWLVSFFLLWLATQPLMAQKQVVSTFDELSLSPDSWWNGADGSGGFVSGLVFFPNDYNAEYGAWSGWSYSNMANDSTPGFMNQYSAIAASGFDPDASGGSNYALTYAAWGGSSLHFTTQSSHEVKGLYVTNSTYTALAMRDGDDYAKKFGGESGDDPDWFLLKIAGMKDGAETGTVDFYLADYRFADNADDYIVTDWAWVALSSLGRVDSLVFTLSSSDMGTWGMNTPAYFCIDNLVVVQDEAAYSGPHYIAEVIDYRPAPGQLINKAPWGVPESAQSLVGGTDGSMSLGAFGGYVVFAFDGPVANHPDNPYGVDFTIFGNASSSWSEPGAVWVQKDENGNGIPDGIWYELAGSDYFFSTTIKGYEVTYSNPGVTVAAHIPWADNHGNQGFVMANSFSTQPYYPQGTLFPDIAQDAYTLSGTRIAGMIDDSQGVMISSARRAFGYADNQPRGSQPYDVPDNPYTRDIEHAGGDAFDISWAVDAEGQYVELDMIHFVKVQTAMLDDAGWLGEVSTEITGAVVVKPDPEISGELDMLVVKDLPTEILVGTYQLEAFAFHRGRVQPERGIVWTLNKASGFVDENMVLTVESPGDLSLTAHLADRPDIAVSVSATVVSEGGTTHTHQAALYQEMELFPNPATDFIRFSAGVQAPVQVYNNTGQQLMNIDMLEAGEAIDVSGLPAGMYFVRIVHPEGVKAWPFLKQ